MKVNRSKFSKVKAQYEIQKMAAAYIHAEKLIMQNPSLTGFDEAAKQFISGAGETILETVYMTPEEYNDKIAKTQNMTIKEVQIMELEAKLENMAEKGREYLEKEDYESLAELKDWYNATKSQLDKLRGNS